VIAKPIDICTPVLVLGSAGHGGVGVARSLGRLGVSVYIVDPNPAAAAFNSRYCRGKFVWKIDSLRVEHSVKYLIEIGQSLGARVILLPTSDTAALFVASNSGALREKFLFPEVSAQLVQSLYSKKQMYFLAKSLGIPCPDTFFPKSRQDALHFAQQAKFPIILKSIEDHKLGSRFARAKPIARTKHELLRNYEMMEDPEHPNVMLQEYIPGGEDANWMFNGYFDQNSDCPLGATGRKIRQYPPYAGITSLGVCLPNASVAETTKRFMKAIGYRGILDIGYRYDARDGLHKVFDVNPRIGCTFRLFVLDSGMDVARALYLDLTGQAFMAGNALPGRKWMVEDLDLASSFRYWRGGKMTLKEWFRSLSGLQESAFVAVDDPRPALSMCTSRLCQALHLPGTQGRATSSLAEPSITVAQ
jgi:D-aspartate ligase